ncbi:MAG: hypothetical protein E3J78_07250 [Candidatus Cloacimonadota bacterium]|nr:MAG: hypothetical protein E3J78_07250 [Candidatus Cloacimonadota bacterium]
MSAKTSVRRGTTNLGSFTQEELIERLCNGKLSVYDQIFFGKTDEWIEISTIRDIAEFINEDYHWKYRIAGQIRGPLAKQDVIFFIKDGKILANDWLFHPSFNKWKKLCDVDEFAQIAESVNVEGKSEGALKDALQSGFYKVCPNCNMQNLQAATSCKGCRYIFKGNE